MKHGVSGCFRWLETVRINLSFDSPQDLLLPLLYSKTQMQRDHLMNEKKPKKNLANKILLALLSLCLLVAGGYHLKILLEAKYYGITYDQMKKLNKFDEFTEKNNKREFLHDKNKAF